MTIYLAFRGEWPLTVEKTQKPRFFWRGQCQYFMYARWMCFEFLWGQIQ